MARENRRRVRYDQDGTQISESMGMTDKVEVFKAGESKKDTTVNVNDIIEAYVAYMGRPDFQPDAVRGKGEGKCVVCGAKTSMISRKVCGPCLAKNKEELYGSLLNAIANGEKEFTL